MELISNGNGSNSNNHRLILFQILKQLNNRLNHFHSLNLITIALFLQSKLFNPNSPCRNLLLPNHHPHRSSTLLSQQELFLNMSRLCLVLKFRLQINILNHLVVTLIPASHNSFIIPSLASTETSPIAIT